MKNPWAREHFHISDVSRGIDEGINLNIASDALGLGQLGINGRNGLDELNGRHLTTDGGRSGGLLVIWRSESRESLAARIGSAAIDGGQGFCGLLGSAAPIDHRGGEMNFTERGFVRWLRFRSGLRRGIGSPALRRGGGSCW